MHPERHVYFVRKMNYYGGGQSEKLLKIEMDYSTINKNLQNLNYDTPVYICHEGKIIFSNRDGENIGDEYEKFSDYKEVEYKKTSNIYGAQLEIYVLRPEAAYAVAPFFNQHLFPADHGTAFKPFINCQNQQIEQYFQKHRR